MATIKELAEQAGLVRFKFGEQGGYTTIEAVPDLNSLERFAELIRANERDKCAQDYLQDCADAVEAARLEERETCAKLCEHAGRASLSAIQCAKAIRQRGEK